MPANLLELLPACLWNIAWPCKVSVIEQKGCFSQLNKFLLTTRCLYLKLLAEDDYCPKFSCSPCPEVPMYSLFKLANCKDCEPKPVHQGKGKTCIRDKNWLDFWLSALAYWTLSVACPSAEVKFCLAEFVSSFLMWHSWTPSVFTKMWHRT
jgi:hypothetical protein